MPLHPKSPNIHSHQIIPKQYHNFKANYNADNVYPLSNVACGEAGKLSEEQLSDRREDPKHCINMLLGVLEDKALSFCTYHKVNQQGNRSTGQTNTRTALFTVSCAGCADGSHPLFGFSNKPTLLA